MKRSVLLVLLSFVFLVSSAQFTERLKIGIFTPLYLDSAFDATGNFKFNDKNYARFVNQGLDFYLGAQLALDSLEKRGAPLEVFIYDTRSGKSIQDQLTLPEMTDMDLLIGQTNAAETRQIASLALQNKIPFISATNPNDAGVYDNPFFVILNSTIQSHIEGIYRFMQRHHSLDNIIFFKRTGSQENLLKNYFTEFAKNTSSVPLNIKYVELPNEFNSQTLLTHLDSNRRNICIAGSLNESFGTKLTQTLATINNTYPVRVIGMPTWDNFNFSKMSNIEVVYSTPFFYHKNSLFENQLSTQYASTMSTKPGEMFFRGYETMLRFGLLLLDTKSDLASNLTRRGNTVISEFDIQPVFKDRTAMSLDYFENKHLYFIKVFGGVKNVIE